MRMLNTSTKESNYTQTVALDGAEYDLKLRWNQRDGRWYLSLSKDGSRILSGVRVVSNWDLSPVGRSLPWPPGVLFAADMTGIGTDPGLAELGERVVLAYFEEADV